MKRTITQHTTCVKVTVDMCAICRHVLTYKEFDEMFNIEGITT